MSFLIIGFLYYFGVYLVFFYCFFLFIYFDVIINKRHYIFILNYKKYIDISRKIINLYINLISTNMKFLLVQQNLKKNIKLIERKKHKKKQNAPSLQ